MLRSKQRKGGNRNCDYRLKHIETTHEFSPKISMYGLTCRRCQKTGTFYPVNREEQALYDYHENTRFSEDLRDK